MITESTSEILKAANSRFLRQHRFQRRMGINPMQFSALQVFIIEANTRQFIFGFEVPRRWLFEHNFQLLRKALHKREGS